MPPSRCPSIASSSWLPKPAELTNANSGYLIFVNFCKSELNWPNAIQFAFQCPKYSVIVRCL
ncbi:hypothetical protein HYPGJ_10593 [Hyphomicrobium sp. GJ21]|nr:hypothetical protein HYPGJ_10593 [Hyphomicrobium sp. GJ21]